MDSPILPALTGTGITFLATALGAAVVFFVRRDIMPELQHAFLGFAAGVMIAASVWSLLIPAMELSAQAGGNGWLPAAGGFLSGGAFLLLLDKWLPHLHLGADLPEGRKSALKRTTMLVLAVTLHNIPEGMAVGLSFALAAQTGGETAFLAAVTLAIGMALQNLPEGAAISLPLHKEGLSKCKSFLYGALSGAVEPVAGVVGVLLAVSVAQMMPFLLSFAAGAMVYVTAEELIPEANAGKHSNAGTIGVMLGFALMMALDVALG